MRKNLSCTQIHPTSCNSASLRWRTMNRPPISIVSPVALDPVLGGIGNVIFNLFCYLTNLIYFVKALKDTMTIMNKYGPRIFSILGLPHYNAFICTEYTLNMHAYFYLYFQNNY